MRQDHSGSIAGQGRLWSPRRVLRLVRIDSGAIVRVSEAGWLQIKKPHAGISAILCKIGHLPSNPADHSTWHGRVIVPCSARNPVTRTRRHPHLVVRDRCNVYITASITKSLVFTGEMTRLQHGIMCVVTSNGGGGGQELRRATKGEPYPPLEKFSNCPIDNPPSRLS